MTAKNNKGTSKAKHGQSTCKPTKRRANPIVLAHILEGLQVATDLQNSRYTSEPSSQSFTMAVFHNGNAIINCSFDPGQSRRFEDALLDCDVAAREREAADNGFPAISANANPRDIDARTSGPRSLSNVVPLQPAQHADGSAPQASPPFAMFGTSTTRTMFGTDPYFDVIPSSMTMAVPNPPEFPLSQYSNFVQQQFGSANPFAQGTIPGPAHSSNPDNALAQGQDFGMSTQFSQAPNAAIWSRLQHSYASAPSSGSRMSHDMHQYSLNATEANREVVSYAHPISSSRQSEQQRQQYSPQSQTGVGLSSHYSPPNVSGQIHHTIASSQMQTHNYCIPSDVPIQAHHQTLDDSWYRSGIVAQSEYGPSPSSYSSNSTGQLQMQAYDSSLNQVSHSDALLLAFNNSTMYAAEFASLGGSPFSTTRTSISPNNGVGPTEMLMQNISMPSPLLALSNMPNFGSSAPLLPFPIAMSSDDTLSDIHFNNFETSIHKRWS
ncbi:hypothetical protein D9619_000242 [Psilocybe cf. subviscida]|uniref:Uncharacterized protein n=1 Tax=Psilocybe cf. subviscida TaxID=2480587 RepID=A0A8H5BE13_9AGAR|nr:hypothetical protein D9619_000242 [Psilocybe cf. subviscida]